MPEFCLRSISLEQIDRFSPHFIYAFILTRSSLGLLHTIFCPFKPEFWPVLNAKFLFPLNILRTNWQIFTKFYIYIDIDKLLLVTVTLHFLHICIRILALDLRKNLVFSQYLENKLPHFHCPPLIYATILFLHNVLKTNWQIFIKFYICISCHFSQICSRVKALDLRQNFVFSWISWEQIGRISPNLIWQDLYWRTLERHHLLKC